MSSLSEKYCYEIWEIHKHEPIPEYESDGKTLRTWVTWPCRLCGAALYPDAIPANYVFPKDSNES